MEHDLWVLALIAASAGFVHTLLGPDHYLPFVALARAEGWTRFKTARVTLLCGAGHLASAALAGLAAACASRTWAPLGRFDGMRAGLAAWLLMGLGVAYALWGLRRALAPAAERTFKPAPLALLAVFVLGPCEPLIPTLMLSGGNPAALALIAVAFSSSTLATMLAAVLIGARVPGPRAAWVTRYRHALAGAALAACALAV